MRAFRLSEIANVEAGGTPSRTNPSYWNGEIPWVKISDISSKYVDHCDEKISDDGLSNSSAKVFSKGTILYTIFATLGRVGILTFNASTNQAIAGIKITDQSIDSDYLYYYLRSQEAKVKEIGNGVAQKNINLSILRNWLVPFTDERHQKEIVSKLSTIETAIDNKNKQLLALDNLIKSRFSETFIGKDFPLKTLDSLSKQKGQYGAQSASIKFDKKRPRYIRITDINDDGSLNDDYVSSKKMEDDNDYKLEDGDFVFARTGATVGKTYVFNHGNQIYAGYLIRYKLNQDLLNPIYLFWFTKTDSYWRWVKNSQSGAAQPGINAKKYGSLLIPTVPIKMQNEFASFAKLIDKSKFIVQKELNDLQELLDSMMDEYFGGTEE